MERRAQGAVAIRDQPRLGREVRQVVDHREALGEDSPVGQNQGRHLPQGIHLEQPPARRTSRRVVDLLVRCKTVTAAGC